MATNLKCCAPLVAFLTVLIILLPLLNAMYKVSFMLFEAVLDKGE